MRAAIYQSLTASRLRVLHRKVAEAMEHLHPEIPDEVVSELGRHYFLGKVPAEGVRVQPPGRRHRGTRGRPGGGGPSPRAGADRPQVPRGGPPRKGGGARRAARERLPVHGRHPGGGPPIPGRARPHRVAPVGGPKARLVLARAEVARESREVSGRAPRRPAGARDLQHARRPRRRRLRPSDPRTDRVPLGRVRRGARGGDAGARPPPASERPAGPRSAVHRHRQLVQHARRGPPGARRSPGTSGRSTISSRSATGSRSPGPT